MSGDPSFALPTREEDPLAPFYDWFDHGRDRAIAITLPVLLEELLERFLRLRMRPDKAIAAEFFRPTGPLGNYGAKVRMSHMLGIVDENVFRDLNIIGKIRNRFAHDIDVKRFDDPVVTQWVNSLSAYKTLKSIAERELTGSEPDYRFLFAMKFTMSQNTMDTRHSFRECCRFYAMVMNDLLKRAEQNGQPTPSSEST